MRRFVALVALAALGLASAGCRDRPQGMLEVVVIGDPPKVRDPALGTLSVTDRLLLASSAQGLVRFDAAGNVVGGLAERWTVSDDGLSYIFRLQSTNWHDGRKISAEQVARLLKRQLAPRSKNALKDRFGAIEDIVAMTDRVIEIRLLAPRPDLLALLAQPEMAIVREGQGTGPFRREPQADGAIRLSREIVSFDDETNSREDLRLRAASAPDAVRAWVAGEADLVLGGTFVDLPVARRAKLPRDALRFDPALGLFGLLPLANEGPLADRQVRQLLSQAIDRQAFIASLAVPGLVPRATLLEPGLDGLPPPSVPTWLATPYPERLPMLQARAAQLLDESPRPTIRVALPEGPGADLMLQLLQRSWSAIGFEVQRAQRASGADFVLVDEVAPSSSPAWFVRRFRCGTARLCVEEADELMDAARQSPVPGQRYALYGQAAALIDDAQLFLPIAAPVRWSLVSARVQNFVGNRYARHTLTDLEARP